MADYSFGPPAPEGQLSSPEGLVCTPAEDGNSTSPLETQSNSALGEKFISGFRSKPQSWPQASGFFPRTLG